MDYLDALRSAVEAYANVDLTSREIAERAVAERDAAGAKARLVAPTPKPNVPKAGGMAPAATGGG